MKNVTFSEKNDIEKILASCDVTPDNVNCVISSLSKYNFHVLHMDDKVNFDFISKWLKKHYDRYIETEFFDIINSKIAAAHKYNLLESDSLVVYQSELDAISSVNDIKTEKILFTVLCVAKLQKNIFGYKNGKYKFKLTNLFKLARVHIPSVDREMFMHNLYKLGFIDAPYRNNDDSRWVTFMSDDEDKNVVLTINEIDFDELAYVYLNWKNNGQGYSRCQICNRLIKQSKTKPRKYCEECAKNIITKQKRLWAEKNRKNITKQNN